MPELRGQDTSAFTPHPCAARDIRYRDKGREKQRQQKLQQLDLGGELVSMLWVMITSVVILEVVSKKKQLKNAILIEKVCQNNYWNCCHYQSKGEAKKRQQDASPQDKKKAKNGRTNIIHACR